MAKNKKPGYEWFKFQMPMEDKRRLEAICKQKRATQSAWLRTITLAAMEKAEEKWRKKAHAIR